MNTKTGTNEPDVARIAEEALDSMCASVQSALGVEDGGPASIYFSGENGDEAKDLIRRYVEFETDWNRDDEEPEPTTGGSEMAAQHTVPRTKEPRPQQEVRIAVRSSPHFGEFGWADDVFTDLGGRSVKVRFDHDSEPGWFSAQKVEAIADRFPQWKDYVRVRATGELGVVGQAKHEAVRRIAEARDKAGRDAEGWTFFIRLLSDKDGRAREETVGAWYSNEDLAVLDIETGAPASDPANYEDDRPACEDCNGSGYVPSGDGCGRCGGTGRVDKPLSVEERVEVDATAMNEPGPDRSGDDVDLVNGPESGGLPYGSNDEPLPGPDDYQTFTDEIGAPAMPLYDEDEHPLDPQAYKTEREAGGGRTFQLADGTIIFVTFGHSTEGKRAEIGVYDSEDSLANGDAPMLFYEVENRTAFGADSGRLVPKLGTVAVDLALSLYTVLRDRTDEGTGNVASPVEGAILNDCERAFEALGIDDPGASGPEVLCERYKAEFAKMEADEPGARLVVRVHKHGDAVVISTYKTAGDVDQGDGIRESAERFVRGADDEDMFEHIAGIISRPEPVEWDRKLLDELGFLRIGDGPFVRAFHGEANDLYIVSESDGSPVVWFRQQQPAEDYLLFLDARRRWASTNVEGVEIIGQRDPVDELSSSIAVFAPDGRKWELPHVVYHSPTGMEWGYAGSGPADLALSILRYVLDENLPIENVQQGHGASVRLHGLFKDSVVAGLRRPHFRLRVSDVVEWIGIAIRYRAEQGSVGFARIASEEREEFLRISSEVRERAGQNLDSPYGEPGDRASSCSSEPDDSDSSALDSSPPEDEDSTSSR
jgi:hypothetical protein